MRNRVVMNLRMFDGAGAGGNGDPNAGNNGNGGPNAGNSGRNAGATYSYEQAEEIANARADRATRAALSDYFRRQGMSETEVTQAIDDFKAKKAKSQPDVSALEKERDDAKKELEVMKHASYLRDKGVSGDDVDYVLFKVSQLVDDKTDFNKAVDKFLKENPRFSAPSGGTYHAAGAVKGGGSGTAQGSHDAINDRIRNAFRH